MCYWAGWLTPVELSVFVLKQEKACLAAGIQHIMRAELAMSTDNCFGEKGVREREESGIFPKILVWSTGCTVVPLMKMGKAGREADADSFALNMSM